MTKLIVSIIFIFVSLLATGQKKDTIFLKKEIIDTPYKKRHFIFIDSGQSCIDSNLHVFNFDWIKEHYKDEFKERLGELKNFKNYKTKLKNFPRQWIMLHTYKNELFTYSCGGVGHNQKIELTDSTFIWYDLEGPNISKLANPTLTANKLSFKAIDNYTKDSIIIDLLDTNKGIAIMKVYSLKDRKIDRQELLLNVDKSILFRTIVDYCEEEECDFNFDETDFIKLKKSYTQH